MNNAEIQRLTEKALRKAYDDGNKKGFQLGFWTGVTGGVLMGWVTSTISLLIW